MTTLVSPPAPGVAAGPSPAPRRLVTLGRAARAVGRRRSGILALGAVLLVCGVIQAVNMYGAPQRADDEGTYVTQAWALLHWHTLAHYTYWYDHPPLGWMVMALWFLVTGGTAHAPSAVDAGRQFMVVVQELSAALLYLLARRVGLARWTSALAVLAFSLSPLALYYHRMVYLDNVGTPLMLAAFVLALSPRRHLSAVAASGVCFAMAVLCKETFLLLLPAFAWQVWRNADRRTRAFAVSTAATMLILTGAVYVLYAALKGELLPGKGHVSLIGAIEWQLGRRAASGSVLSSSSSGHHTLSGWLASDAWLLGAGAVFLPLAYLRRSTRALAVAFSLEALALLRPGYLPIPFVIGMLPFAALVAAAAVDTMWQWRPAAASDEIRRVRVTPLGAGLGALRGAAGSTGAVALRAAGPLAAVLCLAVAAVAVTPAWARGDSRLLTAKGDLPYLEAQHWVTAHVPRYDRVLVDDGLWLDLVSHGFPANQVVWFYKLGTDPHVQHQFPQGWRDFQFIVSTDTVRGAVGGRTWLGTAVQESTPVASWGSGPQRVVVLRIPQHP